MSCVPRIDAQQTRSLLLLWLFTFFVTQPLSNPTLRCLVVSAALELLLCCQNRLEVVEYELPYIQQCVLYLE